MKLSKKSEYGLRALLELLWYMARVLQRHEIAARQHIPVEFLEQILLALKRAGLLSSRRGMKGGYALIKSPEELRSGKSSASSMAHWLPSVVSAKLRIKSAGTVRTPISRLSGATRHGTVRDAIAGILDHYTLADFAAGSRKA